MRRVPPRVVTLGVWRLNERCGFAAALLRFHCTVVSQGKILRGTGGERTDGHGRARTGPRPEQPTQSQTAHPHRLVPRNQNQVQPPGR